MPELPEIASAAARAETTSPAAPLEPVRAPSPEPPSSAERLRLSEAKFRAVFEQAGIGIGVADGAWRILDMNPAFASMLGYRPEELIGKTIPQITHPDDLPGNQLFAEEAAAGMRDTYELEKRFIRKDGTPIWVRLTASVVRGAAGELLYNIGMAEDITARRRAEDALRESEARFRSLIENGSELVAILDANGVVRYHSPTVQRILGFDPEAVIGAVPLAWIHPDDREIVTGAFCRLIAEPWRIEDVEYRLRHRDGSWRILHTTAQNRLADSAVRGVVTNSRDVTDRRRLEEQLAQAQKMEAVGRLAGGIAHDFNNVLTAILGHTHFALDEMGSASPAVLDLREIARAAERAADLTRQLLAFSRRQVLLPELVDLNAVAADLERMLRRLIGEDIELVVRMQPGLGGVRADLSQLEQVVMNLIVNARDAMPAGGRLLVETADVLLDAPPPGLVGARPMPGPYVVLEVSDNGHGIPAETLPHIFEPFFTTKEMGRGTGLGLATVYGVVEQSGGFVAVESEPGLGTSFRIFLPRAEAVEPAPDATTVPDGIRGAGVILLVEDEAPVRALARRILDRAGYRVLAAADGAEGLRLAREHTGTIHLLLTDVVMPGLGGHDLAREVTGLRPDIRVLFVSGYDDGMTGSDGVPSGAAFLGKPFSPDQLRQVVRAVLGAPRPGSAGA